MSYMFSHNSSYSGTLLGLVMNFTSHLAQTPYCLSRGIQSVKIFKLI